MGETREAGDDIARRVVLSYRSADPDDRRWARPDDETVRELLSEPAYLRYLVRAHGGPVAVGEEWEEFVNCGCATLERVVLRVEVVEGGRELGTETAIALRSRRSVGAERA